MIQFPSALNALSRVSLIWEIWSQAPSPLLGVGAPRYVCRWCRWSLPLSWLLPCCGRLTSLVYSAIELPCSECFTSHPEIQVHSPKIPLVFPHVFLPPYLPPTLPCTICAIAESGCCCYLSSTANSEHLEGGVNRLFLTVTTGSSTWEN